MVFEVYRDAVGHYLWRLRRKGGERRLIAICANGYATHPECLADLDLVAATSVETPIIDLSRQPES